ncbi:MAG: cbb3-type cytochrome c oxidase subunit II [Bacteroidota bacterium]
MFNFHTNHRHLVSTALLGFLLLSILVAIVPAMQMQAVEALPGQKALSEQEKKGLRLYISEGCVACHTQQVRNIDMDKVWGDRPSLASDYYYSKQRLDIWRQSPSLLGSERTGPDLTNVGVRQVSQTWHLLHLYNPRSVVDASIMPGYPWLFEEKPTAQIDEEDVVLKLKKDFYFKPGKELVASTDALALVAYLQSLQQTSIGTLQQDFIPSSKDKDKPQDIEGNATILADGSALFTTSCAACHQQNGEGVAGAFPSLVGSAIVNDPNPDMLIRVILQGYDARSEYGLMPSFAQLLNDAQVAAIATHERSSWGNEAEAVSPEDVQAIRKMIQSEVP